MIRRIAAAVVLCMCPSIAGAQVSEFTVRTAAANVHKAPTVASPVIGKASPGARLEVTRDVGSWVKVAWPDAPDGIGYIRKAAGSIAQAQAQPPAASRAANGPAPAAAPTPALSGSRTSSAQVEPTAIGPRPVPAQANGVTSASHRFGLGGLIGGTAMGAGVSARAWSHARLGVQVDMSRYSFANPGVASTMTSTQVGPRVLYALNDRVSDYTWLRPYIGAGARLYRSTFTDPTVGLTMTDSRMGAQVFGGAELTFSSVPRLGLSADLGYHWVQSPFAGYALNGAALTAAGHWYVK